MPLKWRIIALLQPQIIYLDLAMLLIWGAYYDILILLIIIFRIVAFFPTRVSNSTFNSLCKESIQSSSYHPSSQHSLTIHDLQVKGIWQSE